MSKRNVVHIEIPAVDIKAAGEFYEGLFGWKLTHDETFNYMMWDPSEGPGGGFAEVTEEYPVGQLLVHIASEDIEADLKAVERLGGKVAKPKTEIPGIGWYAIFRDPTGNAMALYTSMNPDFNK